MGSGTEIDGRCSAYQRRSPYSTARSAHSAPLGSDEGPGSYVSYFLPAQRALLPCRVVELASGLPTGLRVEASRGSSGSPSAAAPALTPRCELVKAPGDREYCDIASSSAESPCTGSLCVLKPLARLAPVRRPGAVPGPSRSVSQQVLQNLKIQCLVGHDPLQPSVLLFDLLQASRLVHVHTSVLRAPSIVRRLSDPVPAAYLTDRRSSVHFLQNRNCPVRS